MLDTRDLKLLELELTPLHSLVPDIGQLARASQGGNSYMPSTSAKVSADQRLQLMIRDMESAPPLYRPTNFWQSGLPAIMSDLKAKGFENFRNHPSATIFYAPTFREPRLSGVAWPAIKLLSALSFVKRARRVRTILQEGIDGTDEARRMYQIYLASLPDGDCRWAQLSESTVGGGERFEFDGRLYSKSLLNYLLGLNFLTKMVKTKHINSAVEIGGGYGTFGEILLKSNREAIYVNVDIPPVAAISSYYLEQVFGAENVLTYEQTAHMDHVDLQTMKGRYKAVVLCPWQLPKVSGTIDLFLNFISFQEMEPEVVHNYIDVVSGLEPSLVLLRNSKFGKTRVEKAGKVGVFDPVTTDQMVAWFKGYELLGRDSFVFGSEIRGGSFWSEVLCMRRQHNA